jgi:hypothetical protein
LCYVNTEDAPNVRQLRQWDLAVAVSLKLHEQLRYNKKLRAILKVLKCRLGIRKS